jgi:DNA invertase Pin-like site-specific DNA recombinase
LLTFVISAFAEFERDCIRERIRGLRNAKAKGTRLGRPRILVDAAQIALLRRQGASWATIAKQLSVGEGTVRRAALASAKNPPADVAVSPCETIAA